MYGLGAEVMGPPQDPNQPASETAPDTQQQIADIWSYLWSGPGASVGSAPATVPQPAATWIPGVPNTLTVLLGAGVFLMAAGGRRR